MIIHSARCTMYCTLIYSNPPITINSGRLGDADLYYSHVTQMLTSNQGKSNIIVVKKSLLSWWSFASFAAFSDKLKYLKFKQKQKIQSAVLFITLSIHSAFFVINLYMITLIQSQDYSLLNLFRSDVLTKEEAIGLSCFFVFYFVIDYAIS